MVANPSVRHVRLFKNGRSQAVRIPREFELPGDEAILWRDDKGRLVLESSHRPNLLDLLAAWGPLDPKDKMPVIEDPPPESVEF